MVPGPGGRPAHGIAAYGHPAGSSLLAADRGFEISEAEPVSLGRPQVGGSFAEKEKDMFTLTKEFKFEAAHFLPRHDGKCQRLHGHSWVGRVILCSVDVIAEGPKVGMVMDFSDVSSTLKPLLENYLDHWCLNQTLMLENPTSEEVARWIYVMMKPKLPLLVAVEVDETCTSSCRYEE